MVVLYDSTTCNFTFDASISEVGNATDYALTLGDAILGFKNLTVRLARNSANYSNKTIQAHIYDTDKSILRTSVTTHNSDDVPVFSDEASMEEFSFVFPSTDISSTQSIGISFPGAGGSGYYLLVARSSSANTCSSPSLTQAIQNGGSWSTGSNQLMDQEASSDAPITTSGTRDPPPPFNLVSF